MSMSNRPIIGRDSGLDSGQLVNEQGDNSNDSDSDGFVSHFSQPQSSHIETENVATVLKVSYSTIGVVGGMGFGPPDLALADPKHPPSHGEETEKVSIFDLK